jgi:hypothetical protein
LGPQVRARRAQRGIRLNTHGTIQSSSMPSFWSRNPSPTKATSRTGAATLPVTLKNTSSCGATRRSDGGGGAPGGGGACPGGSSDAFQTKRSSRAGAS